MKTDQELLEFRATYVNPEKTQEIFGFNEAEAAEHEELEQKSYIHHRRILECIPPRLKDEVMTHLVKLESAHEDLGWLHHRSATRKAKEK